MERFLIGPKPRTILSYFSSDAEPQTVIRESAAAAEPMTVVEQARLSVIIFCDGACINNGRRGARAAFGMVAYRGSSTSLEEELFRRAEALTPAEPQTNQRGELRGLSAAVAYAQTAVAAGATTVRIYTDSEYALNCLTKWIGGWRRDGWRRSDGSPVLHRDILEPLYDAWSTLRGVAFLSHVAAHTGRDDALSLGNIRADELARAALKASISGYF